MDARTKALELPDGSFPSGTLLFYADNSPGDILIRLFSGSYWSHCAIALPFNQRLEAWAGEGVRVMGGQRLQLPNFAARALPRECNAVAVIAKAMAVRGKSYDLCGWAGNPLWNLFRLRMEGGPPDTFHCSSLIAYATGHSFGRSMRAVTPQDVYNWADK